MLNFNQELEKFQPCADLEAAEENFDGEELEQIKKNKTELYKANQMLKKYNQALNYAKQGNDDLAMLQLKNVVATIPNFTDAYLLIALLSIKAKDSASAKEALDTILSMDPQNQSAKDYMQEIQVKAESSNDKKSAEAEKKEKKKEKIKTTEESEKPKMKNPFTSSPVEEGRPSKSPMFYMVTGIIIGVIVASVLIYPTLKQSFKHKSNSQVEDYQEQILAKDTQLKDNNKKVKAAQDAQKKAEDELKEYIGSSKKAGVYDLLLKALQQYADKNYTEAANALVEIDRSKLTTKNMKSIYDDLKTKVTPYAYNGLYGKGYSAYVSRNYKGAINYLKKAIKFKDSNVNAYIYLAKSYEANKDKKNAIKTYQAIIKKFPSTNNATSAQAQINRLQQKKTKKL
ncbi:tetratricopeptide repeat protein [Anaerostipes sp.]|uniref:tetratricopeptide repeat protein n=1 Tax=Anaerostipes sp. TaxID=1872530 RepID=UPI003FF0DE35